MTRRILWTSIGILMIVASFTAAWAQTQRWRAGYRLFWFHYGPMGYVAHELELSDVQKSQIKTIWGGERPNIAELIRELASEQREMDEITFQSTPDERRIPEIAAHQGATLARLFAEKEKLTSTIYSQVLNPRQRVQADQLQKQWDSYLDQVASRIGETIGKQ